MIQRETERDGQDQTSMDTSGAALMVVGGAGMDVV